MSLALERWERLDHLLEAALDLPPAARRAFLEEACPDDPTLRAEVERLLAADALNRSFLEQPALRLPAFEGEPERVQDPEAGKRLGAYRLVAPIGMGGMGLVYLAERDDRQYEQRVAIKLLRRGVESVETRERLRRERQALAHLHHPHIARLYDGGTTEDGRPYLVIEHVAGQPLDEFCDARRLGIEARLRLFLDVCSAVQHAHRHLLVHRDLKPANILVSADGEPKLLDFGIAKDLGGSEAARMTLTGERAMTPSYASPEQVRGETVTTATDVYSLGVILYQLLSGRTPYRLSSRSSFELERAVCEQMPESMAAAVGREGALPVAAELARRRSLGPLALTWNLRGDLDAIVGRALRKEPARRYGSVAELARDLERFLDGQPVSARRDTAAYRCRKFVSRHRVGAAVAAATLCFLVTLTTALVANARQTERERDSSREAMSFFVETLTLDETWPAGGGEVTARELLERGVERLRGDGAPRPEVKLPLLAGLARIYLGLQLPERAEPLLAEAEALQREGVAAGAEIEASLLELRAQALRQQAIATLAVARSAQDALDTTVRHQPDQGDHGEETVGRPGSEEGERDPGDVEGE